MFETAVLSSTSLHKLLSLDKRYLTLLSFSSYYLCHLLLDPPLLSYILLKVQPPQLNTALQLTPKEHQEEWYRYHYLWCLACNTSINEAPNYVCFFSNSITIVDHFEVVIQQNCQILLGSYPPPICVHLVFLS